MAPNPQTELKLFISLLTCHPGSCSRRALSEVEGDLLFLFTLLLR